MFTTTMSTVLPNPIVLPDVPQTKSLAVLHAIKAIDNLDFREVKAKLMLPENKGWTQDQADTAEKWYVRFLKLHAIYPEHRNVPNSTIDTFWHAHILDTKKYEADCKDRLRQDAPSLPVLRTERRLGRAR